jgi:hypothetical protein
VLALLQTRTKLKLNPPSLPNPSAVSPAWEFRFHAEPEGKRRLKTNDGWVIASFRTRNDGQREYLLKRPRP